jgi:hypothetical protein
MTDHVWAPIPDDYRARKRLGTNYKNACWNCGKFAPSIGNSCEYYLNQGGWVWGPGGPDDPFASMRTNGKATGPLTANPLGTLGVGGHGMPIRRDVPVPAPGETAWSKTEPAEKRPGLAPEAIDWEAFKTFGKGL